MKIVSVVGARPEFVQATPVSRALRARHQEILVHTGQHYDYEMSQRLFEDLELPKPDHSLDVGSGTHAEQTALILTRFEAVLEAERPDAVLVRGDTNSTLGGALAAAKMGLPVIHIEAGERCFDRHMPEEINRVVTDRIADLHLCASRRAVTHLRNEGIADTVEWIGDVMYDVFLEARPIAAQRTALRERLGLTDRSYAVATVHRAGNTDDRKTLSGIVEAFNRMPCPVVFPAHPRTSKAVDQFGLTFKPNVRFIPPLGYLDLLALTERAAVIMTDSGGVQREAYFLGIPCVTLRESTEWVETLETGWNVLAGSDPDRIVAACGRPTPPGPRPPIFGDGHAAARAVQAIERRFPGSGEPREAASQGTIRS